MAGCERAVIYVESGSEAGSGGGGGDGMHVSGSRHSSATPSLNSLKGRGKGGGLHEKNNYVIKIQIGEEEIYDPVTIGLAHHNHGKKLGNRMVISRGHHQEEDSPLNSSGQSSPRSDMTPPPGINTGGSIRFGSETSESDTESDISSEYRPLACPTARFAMREMLDMDPIRLPSSRKTSPPFTMSSSNTSSPSPPHQKSPPPPAFPPESRPHPPSSNLSAYSPGKTPPTFNLPFRGKFPAASSSDHHYNSSSSKDSDDGKYIGFGRNHVMESPRNKILECISDAGQFNKIQLRSDGRNFREYASTIIVDEASFHLNEMSEIKKAGNTAHTSSSGSLNNFAGYKDIFSRGKHHGPAEIMSDKGTIRGVKNRVRDGIVTFLQSTDTKTYTDKEQGRVVVYVTSMGVVRDTFQRCQKVKQILRTLMVKFDERDCYMNRSVQNEIRQRMPFCFQPYNPTIKSGSRQIEHSRSSDSCDNKDSTKTPFLSLPQVFLEGQHLGDAETIERLNETGELRELLRPYKSLSVLSTCDRCGGFRMLPCPICNGSKKSVHRNHFTTEFVALKCMHCDPSGLVKCDVCNTEES